MTLIGTRAIASVSLLLAVGAMPALAADSPLPRRPLTAEDFYRVQELSEPQCSPDGQWVAYVVTTHDREADEARSAIWMVSWDGKERLQLTNPANGAHAPRFSPDGRYLAFVSGTSGSQKAQILLLDRRGGEPRTLTNVGDEIGEYSWSPDGTRLVLAIQRGRDENSPAGPALPKPPQPIVIDALHFKQDVDGYAESGHARHLYLLDLASKQLDALTADAAFNEDHPVWSADGRRIAFVRTHETATDADGKEEIDVIEAHPGAPVTTLARPYAPNQQSLAWSPDGTRIAYLQGLEPKYSAYIQDRLAVIPAGGGVPRPLTNSLDRAVSSYAFAADSASITVTIEDDGTMYPARIDLPGGAIAPLVQGPFVAAAVSSAGNHTAVLFSDDGHPAEVHALEAGGFRKLTAHNDALMAELQIGRVEDLRFKSADGTEIHGLMVKPPSYVAGRKYPAILWIHGGPNGQDAHSLAFDDYQFKRQLLAARGYLVIGVNYRGSSGRGIAFAKAIFADWGHKEVQDLLAAVDHLVARGIADPARLGIGGWSYGGILTDYTIASDRRFKAAMSGAGSANQLATYGTDEYILQYTNELGAPWQNPALWLKVSYPFFHADRIHTPTLFMGGDKDFNVPIGGGEQMYQALRTLGIPTQLVVYPGEYHEFTRPSFLKDRADRIAAWYDRRLSP